MFQKIFLPCSKFFCTKYPVPLNHSLQMLFPAAWRILNSLSLSLSLISNTLFEFPQNTRLSHFG